MMKQLRNLPEQPQAWKSLIDVRPGSVVSMALSRVENVQMTLLAFAAGESVSEESYFGDTMYTVLEGEMPLMMNGETAVVHAGECVAIPAGTLHAIGGAGAFKLLQLTVTD